MSLFRDRLAGPGWKKSGRGGGGEDGPRLAALLTALGKARGGISKHLVEGFGWVGYQGGDLGEEFTYLCLYIFKYYHATQGKEAVAHVIFLQF